MVRAEQQCGRGGEADQRLGEHADAIDHHGALEQLDRRLGAIDDRERARAGENQCANR